MCFDLVSYVEYSVCKHRVESGRQRVSTCLATASYMYSYDNPNKIDCNSRRCAVSQLHVRQDHDCANSCQQEYVLLTLHYGQSVTPEQSPALERPRYRG